MGLCRALFNAARSTLQNPFCDTTSISAPEEISLWPGIGLDKDVQAQGHVDWDEAKQT